ncbi:hypothetical protein H6P81_003619 [Aristolochia fimbriata]|uniref:Protein BIC1 n=1 Tax=Aristolochia fimbriata TaxID=158543 RepID=A0AAV7FE73_ARIFI|nr:hypothetical protein H6P81_003619 [Aristolochia fimbriata]
MIRRTYTRCGSTEEPSKPGPVHDNATELRREETPVPNPQCSSSTEEKTVMDPEDLSSIPKAVKNPESVDAPAEDCGPERLKRHRVDVAGRVWIPEIWGQEDFLKDWIDCSAFDRSLFPTGITSARKALMEEGRRANAGGILQIENRC